MLRPGPRCRGIQQPSAQWRQRESKVGGTNHRMGWGVGGDWSELVASYSRMKTAWGWANGGQPILVCYIRKYIIILGGIFPLTFPPTKILGDVSPASPAGLTPVVFAPIYIDITADTSHSSTPRVGDGKLIIICMTVSSINDTPKQTDACFVMHSRSPIREAQYKLPSYCCRWTVRWWSPTWIYYSRWRSSWDFWILRESPSHQVRHQSHPTLQTMTLLSRYNAIHAQYVHCLWYIVEACKYLLSTL